MTVDKGVLSCSDGWDGAMLPRELDGFIAKELLGWKLTDVPPDADGEHAGQVLTRNGKFPDGVSLPSKGPIGQSYFVPEYSRSLPNAQTLAMRFGYSVIQFRACESSHLIPERICRALIQSWIHDREFANTNAIPE